MMIINENLRKIKSCSLFRCGKHIYAKKKKNDTIFITKEMLNKWVNKILTFKVVQTNNYNILIPIQM